LADGGVGGHAAEAEGGGEKGGGFVFVNADELGFGEVFAFAFEVEDLAADEFLGATAFGEFKEDVFERVAFGGGGVGEDGEGFGEEGVADEDGHAFAVNLMRGGAAAAEVVVVHAGEVIVDEGVGVHDLDGAGGGEGVFRITSAGFGSGEGEDGAEAFSTGEDGVAHALVDGFRADGDAGKEGVEGVIDEDLLAFEVSFEIRHGEDAIRNFGEGNRLLQSCGMGWGHRKVAGPGVIGSGKEEVQEALVVRKQAAAATFPRRPNNNASFSDS